MISDTLVNVVLSATTTWRRASTTDSAGSTSEGPTVSSSGLLTPLLVIKPKPLSGDRDHTNNSERAHRLNRLRDLNPRSQNAAPPSSGGRAWCFIKSGHDC